MSTTYPDANPLTRKARIVRAINLLEQFMNDYQFDPNDSGYLGFLNVCIELLVKEEDRNTFSFICQNPGLFEMVLDALGGRTENGFHENETIFHLKGD
jgi:hypothetical protein